MTPAEELDRAYQMLALYGVPKERAKNLPNGIGVMMARIDKELDALRHERNVLQKICAERADEIDRLKAVQTEELSKPVAWLCTTRAGTTVTLYEDQAYGEVTPLYTKQSPQATICPDTNKPCIEFCDPSKGDRCASTDAPLPQSNTSQEQP